ncbi:MAG: type IV secretory system conjugative DNA transfer family protein [Rhizobium rhizophilum]
MGYIAHIIGFLIVVASSNGPPPLPPAFAAWGLGWLILLAVLVRNRIIRAREEKQRWTGLDFQWIGWMVLFGLFTLHGYRFPVVMYEMALKLVGVAPWLLAAVAAFIFVRWQFGLGVKLPGRDSHGSARFLSKKEVSALADADGLVVGREGGKLVRYPGEAHMLTFAATGSGKGVGSIIPNLLTYPGSVLCIDPKGENALVTARRRRELGQDVQAFDPWGLTGLPIAALNPLDWLHPDNPDLIDDARMLATAMIPDQQAENEAHWTEESRELLAGLALYVAIEGEGEERTLIQVRRYLNMTGTDLDALFAHMAQSPAGDGYVAGVANRMQAKTEKESKSVLSTLQRHTHFLDSPGIKKVLGPSTFDMLDLKRRAVSLYLVLPPEKLIANRGWLRLMVSMAIAATARVREKPAHPILFVLDEFAALGHLETVATAAGLMRGYGVKLWPILQDLPQLKALYPERWQSFIANAGAIQAFGINDHETADYLSKMMGQKTIEIEAENFSRGASGGGGSWNDGKSWNKTGRALLMPDEIMRLPGDEQVVLIRGTAPMRVKRLRYYNDATFAGQFDKNPYV